MCFFLCLKKILIPLVNAELDNLGSDEELEEAAGPIDDIEINDKKVCPQCKSSLPSDSEFCQGCGAKLPVLVSVSVQSSDTTEELLSVFEIMEVRGSHPIIIQSAHLYCSDNREKYYLRCKFKSLSDKVISALMVDVFCMDVWGNELPTIHNAQILDLSPKRDEVFGYSRKIPLVDVNTRIVHIQLKRIKFEDGTIEECTGEETKLPAFVSLSEHLASPQLVQQYICETSDKSSYVPMQVGEFWRCSCGKTNTNVENKCVNCGTDRQIVFESLNEDFLTKRYAAYIENKRIAEEHIKQEQEELKRQRIAEIESERNLAVLKRVATAEAVNKKKKITNAIIIAIVSVLVIVFVPILIINSAKESAYNGQERNIAVGKISDDFSNVYADVVSFEVFYTITRSKHKNNIQISSPQTSSVICWCTTIEGKKFWLKLFTSDYTATIERRGENSTSDYDDQYFSEPIRVRGYMTTFGSVVDNAPSHLEDTLILSCLEILS